MNQTTSTATLRHKSLLSERFLQYLASKVTFEQLKIFVITSPELQKFQQKLEFIFKDDELLFNALIHSSLSNESSSPKLKSNELLEFLGDSVLNLIVADEVSRRFPEVSEGQLSKLRAAIVSEEMLSDMAYSISLDSIMLMGKGEIKTESRLRPGPLSDTLEALLGAAYKEGGITHALDLFLKIVTKFENETLTEVFSLTRLEDFDAKTRLQELAMKSFGVLPEYRANEIENGIFEIELFLAGELRATIRSCSKKKGEKEAATIVIKKLKQNS